MIIDNGNGKFPAREFKRTYFYGLDFNSTKNNYVENTNYGENLETEFDSKSKQLPHATHSSNNNEKNTDKNRKVYVSKLKENETGSFKFSNWNSAVYATIFDTISKMQLLNCEEDYYLDRHIGEKAKSVLSLIKDHLDLDPPLIINEDGDELIFTWIINCNKYYLTIVEDEIYFMELNTNTVKSKSDVITKGTELNVKEFLGYFKGLTRTETKNILDKTNAM